MLQRKIQQLTYFQHFSISRRRGSWQISFLSNCQQTWSLQFQIFFPFAFLVHKKNLSLDHLITTAASKQIQKPRRVQLHVLNYASLINMGLPLAARKTLQLSLFLTNPHCFAICPENYPSSSYYSPELIRLVTDRQCSCLELQRNY